MPIPTTTTTVSTFQVLDPVFVPPPGTPVLAYLEAGLTNLPIGVQVVNVGFQLTKAGSYTFEEIEVTNVVDATPLTISFDITNITNAGFQVTLNGLPDTVNYFLRWRVAVPPP